MSEQLRSEPPAPSRRLADRADPEAFVHTVGLEELLSTLRRHVWLVLGGVAVAADSAAHSFQLTFGRDDFVVEGPAGQQRRAAYGRVVDLGVIRFAVLHRPSAKQGFLQVLDQESAISYLIAKVRVRPRLRTDIVDVAYSAPDPARAQEVVNRVVDVFRAASADAAQRQSKLRREFLEARVKVNDSLLADARQALTEFQRRARPYGSGGSSAREQSELPGLQIGRQQLMAERRTDEALLAALRDSSTSRKAIQTALAAPGMGASPALSQLSAQLFQYEMARDSLASRSARHPDLPRLNLLVSSPEATR